MAIAQSIRDEGKVQGRKRRPNDETVQAYGNGTPSGRRSLTALSEEEWLKVVPAGRSTARRRSPAPLPTVHHVVTPGKGQEELLSQALLPQLSKGRSESPAVDHLGE